MKPVMLLINGLSGYEGCYYGIIEDDTIFVVIMPVVFNSLSEAYILKVRLNDTEENTSFFINVPYRIIDINPSVGFEDPRIKIIRPGHFSEELGMQKASKVFEAQDYIYKNYKPNPAFECKEA